MQDEIIRMARKAGAIRRYWGNNKEGFAFKSDEQLERFGALVAEATKAQPQDNLNCKSVQARLATLCGYVRKEEYDMAIEATKEKAAKIADELYANARADEISESIRSIK